MRTPGRSFLIEELQGHRTMGRGPSGPQRRREEGGLDHLLAGRAGGPSGLGVDLDTVRTLGRARDRQSDQLAILPGDGPVRTPDDVVETEPGLELLRRQLAHVLEETKIRGIVIVLAHGLPSSRFTATVLASAVSMPRRRGDCLIRASGSLARDAVACAYFARASG